jgi:hypothetical protein
MDFTRLILDKEVNPIMLVMQLKEEGLLKLLQCSVCLSRDRNSCRLVSRCVDLYQMLKGVVIEVIWIAINKAASCLRLHNKKCFTAGTLTCRPLWYGLN